MLMNGLGKPGEESIVRPMSVPVIGPRAAPDIAPSFRGSGLRGVAAACPFCAKLGSGEAHLINFIQRTILGQYSSSVRFPMNKPR